MAYLRIIVIAAAIACLLFMLGVLVTPPSVTVMTVAEFNRAY